MDINNLNLVDELCFDNLVDRLSNKEFNTILDPLIEKDLAILLIAKYKLFLKLAKLEKGVPLTPTFGIDVIWHYHILDTLDYSDFCMKLYGSYLHHIPSYSSKYNSDSEKEINMDYMDKLFNQHFQQSIFVEYKGNIY